MNHSFKEKIKSAAIISLLLISLIQVAILWEGQIDGLPISFFSRLFRKPIPVVNDAITRNDLFVPYRIVISNGEEDHWILSKENSFNRQFWNEARGYLEDIAEGKLRIDSAVAEEWGSVSARRGVLVDFNYTITPGLLEWFLGTGVSSGNSSAITKMMIVPNSNDESSGVVYIYTRGEKNASGYKYSGAERERSFLDILTLIEEDEKDTYREYISMRDLNLDENLSEPDVLFIQASNKPQPYSSILFAAPSGIARINELADIILGNEKDRFNSSYDKGTVQFSNSNNLYRITEKGLFEYENLTEINTLKADENAVGAALMNSYELIMRLANLTNEKASLQLTGVSEAENGRFKFTFDYFINGMPIYINIASSDGDNAYMHAVVIEADSEQVLNCQCLLLEFFQGEKNFYKDVFLELTSKSNIKKVMVSDIAVGYVVNSLEDSTLEPLMVIEEKDNMGVVAIKMPREKGD